MTRMGRRWRIGVGVVIATLLCSLLVGTATGERARSRHAKRGRVAAKARVVQERSAAQDSPGPGGRDPAAPPNDASASLGARLHAAWVFYQALANWQLRAELSPASYALARRGLSLALGLAGASPTAAIAGALTPAPPILEQRPVSGSVSSDYGVRRDPFRRRRHKQHNGVDLRAGRGAPVLAAGPGTVAKAERTRGYGRVVYLDHGGGLETRYAHLQEIRVKPGQFVPPGALVGDVGSSGRATGPHLHFEVREDGRPIPPIEILGLLAADLKPSAWLQGLLSGGIAPAIPVEAAENAPATAAKPKKRAKAKRDRRRNRTPRSRRPTS